MRYLHQNPSRHAGPAQRGTIFGTTICRHHRANRRLAHLAKSRAMPTYRLRPTSTDTDPVIVAQLGKLILIFPSHGGWKAEST